MPSVGHLAVGLAAARIGPAPERVRPWAWTLISDQRFFAPWQPIPVAPIGARIVSRAGLQLMALEALLFAPVWIVAAWPRRKDAA